jgi:hypothetical protein
MSKRKLGISYSTLRRQVRTQVDADLRFIANVHNDVSSDECGDNADTAYPIQVDSQCKPVDVHGECDQAIDNASTSQYNASQIGDFDDCHWANSGVDSDTDEEQMDDTASDVVSQINEWANKYMLPHVAVTELMHILKPHLSELPCDSRTLLHTPRSCCVKKLKSGGEYCHLGLAKGLQELIVNDVTSGSPQNKCLELQFNVDGLPIFKSSSSSLWPILCRLMNCLCKDPFVVGIYYGNDKPADVSEFLAEFVEEASFLSKNGLTVGDKLYTVKIHSFVCDAPARALVKGIKGHSGYDACEKCMEHGEYLGKVIYPGTGAPLRTDISFDEMADENHHRLGSCPLKPLSVGCVSQFGLDYMHMVCLGICRRLLLYWKGPVGPLCVRLGSRAVNELSQKLVSLCPHIPFDFARKPRSVSEVMRWKATEFRQFLLYSGPIVLGDILPENLYHHFMLLSIGIRILICPQLASKFCDYANDLLVLFVTEAGKLYGKEIYVYNVHSVIHLANDVKNLGPLDEFSSFPFENKLGQLKKMIRKPQFPIQQIVYRLAEKQQVKSVVCDEAFKSSVIKHEHSNGPLLASYRGYRQYRWLQTKTCTISLSVGNNCILATDGTPALVQNILVGDGTIVLMCQRFVKTEDAFSYPLTSSRLGIYKVCNKMTDLFELPLSMVAQKCVLLPFKDGFVVQPLLH